MIDATSSPKGPGRLNPLARHLGAPPSSDHPAPIHRAADTVELSTEAAAIRADLVGRVRAEIADGTYLTEAKLAAAADRLLPILTD